jgi:hypothetical protein
MPSTMTPMPTSTPAPVARMLNDGKSIIYLKGVGIRSEGGTKEPMHHAGKNSDTDGNSTQVSADTRPATAPTSSKQNPRWAAKKLSKSKTAKSSQYKAYWLVISKHLKLAVTIVPKVMCSSIRRVFNTLECSSPQDRCAEVRINRKLLSTTNVGNMTRIAFLRDPFERALSAYRNSLHNRYIHINKCNTSSDCTFEEWVKQLAKRPRESFANEHFLPQQRVLQLDQMQYDYIFRLSSASDQHFFWNNLCKRNESLKVNTAQKKVPGLEHFSNSAFKIIADLYAEDLVLWKKALKFGTPVAENEHSLYDHYISDIVNKKM